MCVWRSRRHYIVHFSGLCHQISVTDSIEVQSTNFERREKCQSDENEIISPRKITRRVESRKTSVYFCHRANCVRSSSLFLICHAINIHTPSPSSTRPARSLAYHRQHNRIHEKKTFPVLHLLWPIDSLTHITYSIAKEKKFFRFVNKRFIFILGARALSRMRAVCLCANALDARGWWTKERKKQEMYVSVHVCVCLCGK